MGCLPLEGVRVIDLSHSWAAPHCARILADFGAEVIKVEYPRRLCILRGARKDDEYYDRHPAWKQVNRNKLGMTLDLQDDLDREVLFDLVRIADVVIENSRTGVLERLGVGYARLAGIKPDIIMLSMSAFGHNGPFANYSGYGAVFESVSGIQSLTAYEPGELPRRIRELDVTNGIAGAGAVMTALLHRQATGQGQHIDLSQLEAATHAIIGEQLLEYSTCGTQAEPCGNRHRYYAPQGCYRCRGEDSWVVITIRTEDEWQRFCQLAGHPEWLEDTRFTDRPARRKQHDELDRCIASWTAERDNREIMHLLQGEKIPAGAVFDMDALSRDPHLRDRKYFTSGIGADNETFMGVPFHLSGVAGEVRQPGPGLGEHDEWILTRLLNRPAGTKRESAGDEIGTAYDCG